MKPPMVYDDTIPKAHISIKITAIVHNIGVTSIWLMVRSAEGEARLFPLATQLEPPDSVVKNRIVPAKYHRSGIQVSISGRSEGG